MAITLRFTADTTVPIEVECIRPDRLRSMSVREVASLSCMLGNREANVGDFFDVGGDSADEHVVIEGDCPNVKWVGAEMASG